MKEDKNSISLKFLTIVGIAIIIIAYLIITPTKNSSKKTNKPYIEINKPENTETSVTRPYKYQTTTEPEQEEPIYTNTRPQYKAVSYTELLDELKDYPQYSMNSVEQIVNKFLTYKGYEANSIKVIFSDIKNNGATATGSYPVAQFEFTKGDILVATDLIYKEDIKTIIAIIGHELDHFEKIAKVCKFMGSEEFFKFLEENKIREINKEFWRDIEQQTKLGDFNGNYYKEALKRYINQNNMELTSSYADYYRLSEGMRNPLEISAYKVSDEIYTHYGMPIEEGPIRKITKTFNEIDWAIYEIIKKENGISNERIAIFDWCYAKAIINTNSTYRELYEKCIRETGGDLTEFWLKFEQTLSGLYGKGAMSSEEVEKILELLNKTKRIAAEGITKEEISNALYYKSRLIKSNIVYPDAVKKLRETTIDLIRYLKLENINDSQKELDAILTAICAENNINTKEDKEISLYYIKFPEEFKTIYDLNNNHKRFHIIYNNESFKKGFEEEKTNNPNITEQQYLIKLLNETRLNVKI